MAKDDKKSPQVIQKEPTEADLQNQIRHTQACVSGLDYYIDFETGYHVMTEKYLLSQGKCCGSGCRHCPY